MGRLKWLLLIPVVVLVLGVAGSFVYVNVIADDPPERLAVRDDDPAAASPSTASVVGVDGIWSVGEGSQAGYRVEEVLFGQSATAVGRTSSVTGQVTIEGSTVTAAAFAVDLTSVASDESRRDNQFRGRIMDVASHPTADFRLTEPIDFGVVPADGATLTVDAFGELSLRGTTKAVTVPLEAKRSGERIEVAGSLTVVFDEWQIPNPSFGPAQVGDEAELEFLLVLARA